MSVLGPEVEMVPPFGGKVVGIDLGVANLAVLSDGTVSSNGLPVPRKEGTVDES